MDSDLRLVVAGGFPKHLLRTRSDVLRRLPYVTEAELAALYKDCFCFVYPTLNEGFGYPPLEAMAHAAPVLAAANTSVPEIAGSGADYFDPRSPTELPARVLRLDREEGYRSRLVQRGTDWVSLMRSRQNDDLKDLTDMLTSEYVH